MFNIGDRVHHKTCLPEEVGILFHRETNNRWEIKWIEGTFNNSTDSEEDLVLAEAQYSPNQIGDRDNDI